MKSFQVYVVALLVFGLIVSAVQDINANSERGRTIWTEHFSDDEKLKDYLRGEFTATEGSDWQNVSTFKENYSISDDRLRAVVMSLYEEATIPNAETISHEGGLPLDLLANNALLWLGKCADGKTKAFLLNLAADQSKDGVLRTVALFAYLRAADANEAKDALIRFLVGEDRMDSQARSSILEDAHTAYQEADLDKKRAILETLYASLANEDAKWLFRVYDNILSRRSQQYANSGQRRSILKRLIHANPTCKADEYAMPELEGRLRELQKIKPVAAISTNLAALDARDFSRPPSEGDAVEAADAPPVPPAEDAATPLKGLWRYALGGAAALILAAACVWVFIRQRKAYRS